MKSLLAFVILTATVMAGCGDAEGDPDVGEPIPAGKYQAITPSLVGTIGGSAFNAEAELGLDRFEDQVVSARVTAKAEGATGFFILTDTAYDLGGFTLGRHVVSFPPEPGDTDEATVLVCADRSDGTRYDSHADRLDALVTENPAGGLHFDATTITDGEQLHVVFDVE